MFSATRNSRHAWLARKKPSHETFARSEQEGGWETGMRQGDTGARQALSAALMLLALSCSPPSISAVHSMSPQITTSPPPVIAVNQVGYIANMPKMALLVNPGAMHVDQPVLLRDARTSEAVYIIQQAPRRHHEGVDLLTVSFDAFKIPGRYFLTQGDLRSPSFEISPWPYAEVSRLMMRSYFLQRCGMAIHDPASGVRHAACHLNDGVLAQNDDYNQKGGKWPATGGWHDAGDYGKYIAPAAATVGRLLNLYENAPYRYPDGAMNIPESGNGRSDLLDEVRYELEWMLRMQRQDGAVYRKLSGSRWPGDVPPERDLQARYVYGISSPETGKFAAVMAQAARVYAKSDADFSRACLKAADRAWAWLESHPEMRVDINPGDDDGSGSYLASDIDGEAALYTDRDDRLAAAGELFMTTGEDRYLALLKAWVPSAEYTLFEWKDHSALVLWTLLRHPDRRLDPLRPVIRSRVLARAQTILQRVTSHPFRLANTRFVWGSNKMAAEEGINLVHAYALTRDTRYRDAALDQMSYLLGRNAFGLSFVSGAGERAVSHVNHIYGRTASVHIPGLLVGGPNNEAQDGVAPKGRGMLSYLDDYYSYSTNEYAIDYNAALIGLIELMAQSLTGD